MADYQLVEGGVVRASDGVTIPDASGNRDWRKYQKWLADGGVPDPTVVPPKPPIGDVVENGIKADPILMALIRRTAKKEGIDEQVLIDEIRAEARST